MKIIKHSLATLTILTSPLLANVIVDETFNYTAGSNLGGQGGWTNVFTGDEVIIASGSLSAAGFRSSAHNSVTFGGAGIDATKTFTADATTVYFSFLMNVTNIGSLNTTGGYFAGLGSNSSNFGTTVWARSTAGGYNIGMEKRTNSPANFDSTVFTISDTVVIVGSYTYGAGVNDDVANLWINPSPATFGGTEPAPTITDAIGNDLGVGGVERFFLRQDSTTLTPGTLVFDELRVGNTYAEVTTVPESSTALTILSGLGLLGLLRRRSY